MDVIWEMISRGVEQLLGRASGPLHLRLVIMPTVATLLAIRAGLRDARAGEPAFLWAIISDRNRRRERVLTARKDITRIVIVALVLDTVYQVFALRAFYVVQALIMAVAATGNTEEPPNMTGRPASTKDEACITAGQMLCNHTEKPKRCKEIG